MGVRVRLGKNRNTRGKPRLDVTEFQLREHQVQIENAKQYHTEKALKWSEKQDWKQLFDEFATEGRRIAAKKSSSTYLLYTTIQDFANYKADGDEDIRRWILKSIGPTPRTEIPWKGDWALKRSVEHTKEMMLVQRLEEQFRSDLGVMKIAAPVAASYSSWQEVPKKMRDVLHAYVGDDIIQQRPTKFKDSAHRQRWKHRQEERLKFYFSWMEKILDFKAKVDHHYLNSIGFNKPNMAEVFGTLLEKTGESGSLGVTTGEGTNALAIALFKMETEKAAMFDMPLPDEYQKVIDIEATEVKDKLVKKR